MGQVRFVMKEGMVYKRVVLEDVKMERVNE